MPEVIGVVVLAAGAMAYLVAVRRTRGWLRHRTVLWLAGLGAVAAATTGPLAEAAHHSFPAHMVGHLLLGLLAPLLLVRSAPVTLALRTLPVRWGRRLSRLLRQAPVRWATEPTVALVLDLGGMWLLYRTGLWAASAHHGVVHVVVHGHVLIAGCLFATAVIGIDPLPHRRRFGHRAAVLVLAVAAHAVLAKTIYAHPPTGIDEPAARVGAMIMYYGGDAVELVMIVVLWADWYRRRGRAGGVTTSSRARSRSASRSPAPRPGRSAL